MITVAFLLFLLAVFIEPMSIAFQDVSSQETVPDILTTAVLNTLPVAFLLVVISSPWILRERRKIIRKERQEGGRARR